MNPSVCAVMLTADRPAMADRAVRCFAAQTYPDAWLLIYDTGERAYHAPAHPRVIVAREWQARGQRIGQLRNNANSLISSDVILHWDDDDWSCPTRIEDQIAQLRVNERDCVGFRRMLFSDCGVAHEYRSSNPRYMLGTSLCYWREAWRRMPFPCAHVGEDSAWQRDVARLAFDAYDPSGKPKMIATIHGGNTASRVTNHSEWRRVPEWDAEVNRILEAA